MTRVPIACAFLSRPRQAGRFGMAGFYGHDGGDESNRDAAPLHPETSIADGGVARPHR
jgi:hypothetical protein